MAKYALIHNNHDTVNEVVDSAEARFEVHADFSWILCPDEVDNRWKYIDGEFVAPPPFMTEYTVARRVHYDDVGAQLDMIYHSYNNGDTDPLAGWVEEQAKIKELFDKNNIPLMNAANSETARRALLLTAQPDFKGPISMRKISLELYDDWKAGTWSPE